MEAAYQKYLFHSATAPVIKILLSHVVPLSLRAIARLSNLQIRSVQLALRKLEDDDLVIRLKSGKSHLFSLNRSNESYNQLSRITNLLTSLEIEKRIKLAQQRLPYLLRFIDEQHALFARLSR